MTNLIPSYIDDLFQYLQPHCKAIYMGGSQLQPYIHNPHDIDFICFGHTPADVGKIRMLLVQYMAMQQKFHNTLVINNVDWSQIRCEDTISLTYYSYLYYYMQLVAGEPIHFAINLLQPSYQKQYVQYIHNRLTNPLIREKHWYHIYRAFKIIEHNSYDLTDEEIDIINWLHDVDPDHYQERQKAIEWCRNFTHIYRKEWL